jgi:hypothetical protein
MLPTTPACTARRLKGADANLPAGIGVGAKPASSMMMSVGDRSGLDPVER